MDTSITFKVDTASLNDNYFNVQERLRKLYFREAPFKEFVSYTFTRYEYNNELTIGVFANEQQIGIVPQDISQQFNLLWVDNYDVVSSISGDADKGWECELTVSFSQKPIERHTQAIKRKSHPPKEEYRKCPICGHRLRRSQKHPEYGLCDICAKKIPWVNEDDYEIYRPTSARAKPKLKTKRNVCAIISLILTFAYLLYCIYYWGNLSTGTSTAEQFGSAIAITLVFPHLIATALAFIFNAIGVILPNRWFVLTGAILYAISIVLFFAYFMFIIIQMILSFIGFALMKPKEQ